MAGEIRRLIDSIIGHGAKGDSMLQRIIETKIILSGVNPHRYTPQSDDDPKVIAILEKMLEHYRSIPLRSTFSLRANAGK